MITDAEYDQILRDVQIGRKTVNFQTAGAKNLFLAVSPKAFRVKTGCSVVFPCVFTRLVVFVLDPLAVLLSAILGMLWLGIFGILLVLPAMFLWGSSKSYYSMTLPTGWMATFLSMGISCSGYLFSAEPYGCAYFVCLGAIIFQNYLLYAIPLGTAMACASQSKSAFALFHELSKGTLTPVFTITECAEYVDLATRDKIARN